MGEPQNLRDLGSKYKTERPCGGETYKVVLWLPHVWAHTSMCTTCAPIHMNADTCMLAHIRTSGINKMKSVVTVKVLGAVIELSYANVPSYGGIL